MISKQTFHWCNLPFFQLEPNVAVAWNFLTTSEIQASNCLSAMLISNCLCGLMDKLLSNLKLPMKFSFWGGNENSSVMAASSPYLAPPPPQSSRGSRPNLAWDPNKSCPKQISRKTQMESLLAGYVAPENIHTPPRRVFSSLTPPPRFSISEGFTFTSPTPWNFHDFSTWSPLPLGNSKSTNKETSLIYFYLLRAIIKFSHSHL